MLKKANAAIRRHNRRQLAAIRRELTMRHRNRVPVIGDARYAVRMWLICVAAPCLALLAIAIVASTAGAAVTYAPASPPRECKVLEYVGAKPVCTPVAPTPPVVSAPRVTIPSAPEYVGHGRTCFPAASWGPVSDAVRPCVRLVAKRGTVRFIVSDADGTVRYSGYVRTGFQRIACVRVVRVAEDGSFTWKARNRDGRTITASVGNLED